MSIMMKDLIVFQKPVNTKKGSRLYLTLYIKQLIIDSVNIRWLANKGLM